MVKGAILLVEKLPDDVSIETVRSAFSDFGEVKWVDINKSAAQVCVVYPIYLPSFLALLYCLHLQCLMWNAVSRRGYGKILNVDTNKNRIV